MSLDRRTFLQLSLAMQAAALAGIGSAEAQQSAPVPLQFGPAEPYDFEALKRMARERAAKDYVAPPRPNPDIVSKIDYDAHGKLRYRQDAALWGNGGSAYPVTFQHVGMFFPKTVKMHAVEGGRAREILYDPRVFMGGPDHVAAKLPAQPSAFAGFWVQESRNGPDWKKLEPWATFLGASYFRAVGDLGQVGLSARGIALAPGTGTPEEFPDFVAFWFEPAASDKDPVTVGALLDGPSITGAYRFRMRRDKGVLMDVEASLFLRKSVERFGIAPLTSMFWYSETVKPKGIDWRPEVHDSDGLAIWTGTGEHIWRPLNNPDRVMVSSFADRSPKGFGLSQRDRNVENYLDGVRYHDRPSAWVEPIGDWGRGAVQLTELPTDDEIHDNIVAMWVPAEPAAAGKTYDLKYRIHWYGDEPFPSPLARVVATRIGRGGQPGHPRPAGVRKFAVEFRGKQLATLPKGVLPEAVITTSRGKVSLVMTEAVPNDVPGQWRATFDVAVDGREPVEMRCFLKLKDQVLSETWLYQYHPF